jgi:hypothetical protein
MRWFCSRSRQIKKIPIPRSQRICDANPDLAGSIALDEQCVLMNTYQHADHPKGDSRLARRTRSVKAKPVALLERSPKTPLGSFRDGEHCNPPPAQKTFDAEGEILEHALTKSFRIRNDAIRSLCSSVHRFRDATIKEECKSDYPHALQALWKALDRAEDLIQN